MKPFKLFLLTILSIVLAACGGNSDDPAEVAENFVQAMVDGDSDKVIDLMYISADMQAELDKDPGSEERLEGKLSVMMGQVKAEIDKNGGVEDISSGDVAYNNDKTEATVPVAITLKEDSKSDTSNLTLIKTDDGWKVKM